MRIIGGELKGRRVAIPKNFKGRPTTDFAREALFNILQNRYDFDQMKVVDLFSGTGAISYEFASRGVQNVLSIEQNHLNVRFIGRVIRDFELENISVYRANVFDWVVKTDMRFDIVFADPPYDNRRLTELPALIRSSNIVNPNGIFILEHPDRQSFEEEEGFLEKRRYGGVNFSLFNDFRKSQSLP